VDLREQVHGGPVASGYRHHRVCSGTNAPVRRRNLPAFVDNSLCDEIRETVSNLEPDKIDDARMRITKTFKLSHVFPKSFSWDLAVSRLTAPCPPLRTLTATGKPWPDPGHDKDRGPRCTRKGPVTPTSGSEPPIISRFVDCDLLS
jgi:hypothetical protein